MPAQRRVVLVLGAGSNIGAGIASKFSQGGYKVVLAARSVVDGVVDGTTLNVKADLAYSEQVYEVFHKTHEAFGAPNVVIYNGANRLTTPPDDPLSASLEELDQARKIGLDSAYVAAQEALRGFRSLPRDTPTAFIYTGNALSQIAIPAVLPFALGKVAAAMMIEYAANAYGKDGYRFYFADERKSDGRPSALERDSSAHADMYWQLAHEPKQFQWLVTFVKNEGRRPFAGVDFEGETRASYDLKFGRS